MSRSLDGRVAIVTGGSREIGAAMADALAADGAAVVVSHHDAPDLAGEVASRIIDEGGRALAVQADLSHPTEHRRLVERTVDEFGRLDVFVANAGVTKRKSFLEMDEETWDTLVDLNLKGAYFGAQAAARTIAAQRADDPEDSYGGRIVFSSSVNGLVAIPDNSAYAATKAALLHLATVLAVELGPRDHGQRPGDRRDGERAEPRRRPRLRRALGRGDADRSRRDATGRRRGPRLPRLARCGDGLRSHADGRWRLVGCRQRALRARGRSLDHLVVAAEPGHEAQTTAECGDIRLKGRQPDVRTALQLRDLRLCGPYTPSQLCLCQPTTLA